YSLVAFRDFSKSSPSKAVFDPAKDQSFPAKMSISPNRNPYWMADLSAVSFGIHELKPKKADGRPEAKENEGEDRPRPARADDEPDKPDMVIWHWKDSRLQPMQQVQETQDKNYSYLCLFRPAEQKFIRLADESMRQVALNAEAKFAIGMDVRD